MQIALFIVQIITLIALIIYVIKTWQMASATRDAAEASQKTLITIEQENENEKRPLVDVAILIRRSKVFEFLITNRGRTTAHDLRIEMEPPFPDDLENKKLAQNKVFENGLRSLHSGVELCTFFSSSVTYLKSEKPREFIAHVAYKSSWGKKYIEHIPIDLGFHDDRLYIEPIEEKIEKHLRRISEVLEKALKTQPYTPDIYN